MAKTVNLCLAVVLGVVIAWLAFELKTVYTTLFAHTSTVNSVLYSTLYIFAVVVLWRVFATAYHQMFRSKVWESTLCLTLPLIVIELALVGQGTLVVNLMTIATVALMAIHTGLKAQKELHL